MSSVSIESKTAEGSDENPVMEKAVFKTELEIFILFFQIAIMATQYADILIDATMNDQDLVYLHFYIKTSGQTPEFAANVIANCFSAFYGTFYAAFAGFFLHALSPCADERIKESTVFEEMGDYTSLFSFLIAAIVQDVAYLVLKPEPSALVYFTIADLIFCTVHLFFMWCHAKAIEEESFGLDEVNTVTAVICPFFIGMAYAFLGAWIGVPYGLLRCYSCFRCCWAFWRAALDEEEEEEPEEDGTNTTSSRQGP